MIRIIYGTFGWNDKGLIRPLTKDSGLIDFLPKETEKRLVEEAGIAEYVDASIKSTIENFELGSRQVEDLDYSDLQKAYKFYGLGNPISKKKNELITQIKKHLNIENIEIEEFGETNDTNLIPEESVSRKNGKRKTTKKESIDDSNDAEESAPNLKGFDGVVE